MNCLLKWVHTFTGRGVEGDPEGMGSAPRRADEHQHDHLEGGEFEKEAEAGWSAGQTNDACLPHRPVSCRVWNGSRHHIRV